MQQEKYSKKREATRQKILDVFLSEYVTKSVGEITVSQICKNTGINRSTFYNYFKDAYDIEDYIEDQMVEGFKQRVIPKANDVEFKPEIILEEIMAFNREKKYLPLLLIVNSNNNFVRKFSKTAIEEYTKDTSISEENKQFITMLVTYHFSGVSAIVAEYKNEFVKKYRGEDNRVDEILSETINLMLPIVGNGIIPVIKEKLR